MDDFIYYARGIISREACGSLIESFDDKKTKKINGPRNGYTKTNKKYFYQFRSLDVVQYIFYQPLVINLQKYKEIYPFLDNSKFGSWGVARACNIQRYEPGENYSIEHCEHGPGQNSNRVLAWMIYLNDIENGGGTFFPHQKRILRPEAGDLYIWPAGWTHSHYGIPADKETKYIVTGWCQFDDRNA